MQSNESFFPLSLSKPVSQGTDPVVRQIIAKPKDSPLTIVATDHTTILAKFDHLIVDFVNVRSGQSNVSCECAIKIQVRDSRFAPDRRAVQPLYFSVQVIDSQSVVLDDTASWLIEYDCHYQGSLQYKKDFDPTYFDALFQGTLAVRFVASAADWAECS
jgi:hypothetical protein